MESKLNKRNKFKKIMPLFMIFGLTAITFIIATYAWFIGTVAVSTSAFTVSISAVDGLELSLNGEEWEDETLTISESAVVGTASDDHPEYAYEDNTNHWTGSVGLIPISTKGEVDDETGRLKLFGKSSITSANGGYRLLATQIDNYTDEEQNGYVVFDLFIRNGLGDDYFSEYDQDDDEAVYLTRDSKVIVTPGGAAEEDYGLANSVRLAFMQVGRVKSNATSSTITEIDCTDSSTNTELCTHVTPTIWEPNNTRHNSNLITYFNSVCKNRTSQTVYSTTSCTTFTDNQDVNTYVVKEDIDSSSKTDIYDNLNTYTNDLLENIDTFTDTMKLSSGLTRSPFMYIAPNSVTKLRVYIYLEGQDVDNYDLISTGNTISVNFGFTKDALSEETPDDSTAVTVTYDAGEGNVSQASATQFTTYTYANLPTPTLSGYNFDGWYTQSSGGTKVTEETTVTNTSDHTLYAQYSQSVNTNSLYYKVSSQAVSTTVNFSIRSGATPTTNGVYTTTSTEGNVPVYYYRGNVNNHVIFNNMCWRIVRTTETGGVKLIYNGTPTDGTCVATGDATQLSSTTEFNSSYNDNAYVGYMYGTAGSSTYAATHTNTNSSTIKTYIDSWYSTNFTSSDVTSKIEDTVYCNDRSTVAYDATKINWSNASSYGTLGYGTNKTLYGAINRASYYTITPSPTLVCSQANDKFTVSSSNGNGALTYPVGLITLDEAVFAGFNTNSSNSSDYIDTNNYLYTGSYYWTLSPVYFYSNGSARVGYVGSNGFLNNYGVNNTFGVRPAVSLKDGTLVSSGNGSSSTPYVIE